MPLRVVIDTDVLVAALSSASGASRQCLLMALRGEVRQVVSVPLMIEYEAVLTRPEHLAASGVDAAAVGALLDDVAAGGERVSIDYLWRPLMADPNDEMVIEAAVNGRADRIVTFNLRDLAAAARRFGITAVRPRELLRDPEVGRA